ncbi:MAG: CopG family transcriptional regulator [Nitrospira defluvii]|nr:CopG family transcriptional regulator [Nitrospira defluvii]
MAGATRTTVSLRATVYRALKRKAASTDRSLSDLINAAVQESLREDRIDLAAFEQRRKESSRPLEKVLEDLKRGGRL